MDSDIILLLLVALFVGTQAVYLLAGLVLDWLFLFGARHMVREPASDPEDRITVLITLYREERAVVEQTLERLAEQEYDLSNVRIVLVSEADDPIVGDYVDDIIATDGAPWTVTGFAVDRSDTSMLERMRTRWPSDPLSPAPRTKAFALTACLGGLEFADDEIVTVFDADTVVAPDLFALAVAGLAEYDIVQAKQTVRNIEDGLLPKLESMGMAAWSGVIYPRTARGPYQLLGKGYFLRARELKRVGGWQPDELTEDMAFGVAAYKQGLELGVLDSYVQDLCPAGFRPWVTQKRRWLGGPYRALGNQPLTLEEKLRLFGVTMVNQAVSLNTVLGLPVGIAMVVLVVGGLDMPLWLDVITVVNLVNWGWYSVAGYRATFDAVTFESSRQKAWYYVVSNPLTQSVYALLWSVPFAFAVWDHLTGSPAAFEVTPKSLRGSRED